MTKGAPELITEKPWGRETIVQWTPIYTVKKILMRKGHQCSYQFHERKHETIYVLEGILTLVVDGTTLEMEQGESLGIKPLLKHRMRATESDCVYLECSTSDLDDIVRLEDDYGRDVVRP